MKLKEFKFTEDGIVIGADEQISLKGFVFNTDGIILGYTSGEGPGPTPPTPPEPSLDYTGWTETFVDRVKVYTSDGFHFFDYYDVTLRSMSEIEPYMFAISDSASMPYADSTNYTYQALSYQSHQDVIKVYNNIIDATDSVISIGSNAFANFTFKNGIINFPNCEYVGEGAFLSAGLDWPLTEYLYSGKQPSDIPFVMTPLKIYLPKCTHLGEGAIEGTIEELWLNSISDIRNADLLIADGEALGYRDFSVNIYLLSNTVVSANESTFHINGSHFHIHVPESLYNDYVNDTFWSGAAAEGILVPYVG